MPTCKFLEAAIAVIGNIVVGARVATGAFKKDLQGARDLLNDFGSALFSTKGALAAVGVAFAAFKAGEAFTGWLLDGIDRIGDMADAAHRLGLSTAEFRQLELAAQVNGVSVETLGKAFTKMQVQLAQAKMGLGDGAKALQTLGLSAQSLNGMSKMEQFRTIATAIAGLPDPAQRSAAAMSIFGKAGAELTLMLQDGAAGIDEWVAKAEKLGATFNEVDVAKAEAAGDAIDSIKFAWDNLMIHGALALAPIVENLATGFLNGADAGKRMTDLVSGGMNLLRDSVGFVVNSVQFLGGMWRATQTILEIGIWASIQPIKMLAKAIQGIANLIPGMNVSIGDFFDEFDKGLREIIVQHGDAAHDAFTRPWDSRNTDKYFNGLRSSSSSCADQLAQDAERGAGSLDKELVKVNGKAGDLVEKLQEQINTFGMSSSAAEIYRLRMDGASDSILRQAQFLQTTLDAMTKAAEAQKKMEEEAKKRQDELTNRGKSITDSMMTPLEKYNETLAELNRLLRAGAINQETFRRAVAKAGQDLKNGKGKSTGSWFTGASEIGSAEARSITLRSRFGNQKTMEQNTAGILKENQEQTRLMRRNPLFKTQNVPRLRRGETVEV